MFYEVLVHCRRQNAIGVYYDKLFQLGAPENATHEQIVEVFQKLWGDVWELHHIVSFLAWA